MADFFIYLFKSCLWIAAFWTVYRLFLRNETFYRFNRWFLIAGLVLSFILPLFQFYYRKEVAAADNTLAWLLSMATEKETTVAAPASFDWIYAAAGLYAAGVLFVLGRSLRELYRINRLIATYGYSGHDGYRLVEVDRQIAPFSFRNYIFINQDRASEIETRIIIAHESAHIREKHWIDLMAGGILRISQWINPFARLLVREMRDNHEFMADRAVLEQGNPKAVYKAVLINNSFGEAVFTLGHPFSASNNLKRYKMMNRKLSSSARKWSALTILPLSALLFMAFAKPRYVVVEEPPVRAQSTAVSENTDEAASPVVIHRGTAIKLDAGTAEPPVKRSAASSDSTRKSGMFIESFAFSFDAVNPPAERSSTDTAKNNTIVLEATMVFPDFDEPPTKNPPLFIIDGVRVSQEKITELKPANIKSVTVLKDSAALALFGENGRNGVVVINTENKKQQVELTGSYDTMTFTGSCSEVRIQGSRLEGAPDGSIKLEGGIIVNADSGTIDPDKMPLFIVDGQKVGSTIVESLDSAKIKSVIMVKDKDAIKPYGKEGRNGVVIIELNKTGK